MVGSLGASIIFALFHFYRSDGASINYARTIAVNALVMIEFFYLFNCRLLTQSIFTPAFLHGIRPMLMASVSVIILQLIFSYWPASQQLFGLDTIAFHDWIVILMMTAPIVLIVELEKGIERNLRQSRIKS